ncbi:hypothetical protein L2E82_35865 [Cichorium intybus]|uniref:Uncharacterized protein n=1 Tax=Cichorium intybus TaxID=13427 RepID=A0ACB9BPZ2_CICIN|nr:hypothetical protein L2E82_35865 [Cichorium intybus]
MSYQVSSRFPSPAALKSDAGKVDLKSSDVSETLNKRELYKSNLDEKEADPKLEHQVIENFDFNLIRYFDSGGVLWNQHQ